MHTKKHITTIEKQVYEMLADLFKSLRQKCSTMEDIQAADRIQELEEETTTFSRRLKEECEKKEKVVENTLEREWNRKLEKQQAEHKEALLKKEIQIARLEEALKKHNVSEVPDKPYSTLRSGGEEAPTTKI